jgi:hypothetical protein
MNASLDFKAALADFEAFADSVKNDFAAKTLRDR